MWVYCPPEELAQIEGASDWWPVPTELEFDAETVHRRDEVVGRMLAWWWKATHIELQQGPDAQSILALNGAYYDLKSSSYRTILAAMELSAQIERYATAHKFVGMSPPDAELIQMVTKAAITYLEAHKPAALDTDFVSYMDACETWGIEVGTPWAEISAAIVVEPRAGTGVF
jgi:hypothetical protein